MNYPTYTHTSESNKNYGIGRDGRVDISHISPAGTPSGVAMPTSGVAIYEVSADVMPSNAYTPYVVPPDVYPTGLNMTYEPSGSDDIKTSVNQPTMPVVYQPFYQGSHQSYVEGPWHTLTKEQKNAYKGQFKNYKQYKKSEEKRIKKYHKLEKIEPNKLSNKLNKIDQKLHEQELEVNFLMQERQQVVDFMASRGLSAYAGSGPQNPIY
jgi:hypothetical protein